VSQGPNTTPELSTSSERVNEKPVSYTTRRLTLDLAQFASTCGLELFQCGPSWGGKCGYRTDPTFAICGFRTPASARRHWFADATKGVGNILLKSLKVKVTP